MTMFMMWVDMLKPHFMNPDNPISEDTKKIYTGLWKHANKRMDLMMEVLRASEEKNNG